MTAPLDLGTWPLPDPEHDWRRDECRANGCAGCFGILLSCGHTFPCVKDPEFGHHRCGAGWTNVLFTLFMGMAVFAITWMLASR